MNARAALMLLALFAACASEPPGVATIPDADTTVVIHVAGDGFVRVDGRRIPLEAIVLELRQRARKMTADERARFVAEIRLDPQPPDSDGERVAGKGRDRLIDEIYIMEFGTVRL